MPSASARFHQRRTVTLELSDPIPHIVPLYHVFDPPPSSVSSAYPCRAKLEAHPLRPQAQASALVQRHSLKVLRTARWPGLHFSGPVAIARHTGHGLGTRCLNAARSLQRR
ncbi:uncharacterized protein B0H18DRAFT_533354 [Fomitopsis serialis]|uniref:uncharacterized protein n=1 Tax=Fomitopsis serialis TaxID=139415 RepID=UPI002008443B|nr:uncharacterized protein B0H18DRAFT_533354 [Neoantrodia serialis]KAH9921890.1 hypothetical protein B0H18DRAFT_533354 [Neoantrodia serialis]